MGMFSKIAARVPRGVAIMTMGFAGIFGMRTPPDPEVVAQTAPSPHAAGEGGDAFCRDEARRRTEASEDEDAPG
jgi:hypothetical protein